MSNNPASAGQSPASTENPVIERIVDLLAQAEKLAIENNFPTAICVARPNGVPIHCGVSGGESGALFGMIGKLHYLTVITMSVNERVPS